MYAARSYGVQLEFPLAVAEAFQVQGIDGGADDYMAKPFRVEAVLARLRALIRRASGRINPELGAGLARTLLRLHADGGLAIQVDVDPEHTVRSEREDLDEMLGNLLDNACKRARSQITIASSSFSGTAIVITVDVTARGWRRRCGKRCCSAVCAPMKRRRGRGSGLAIVRDLAEVYGGSIALASSRPGGLRARLQLPN